MSKCHIVGNLMSRLICENHFTVLHGYCSPLSVLHVSFFSEYENEVFYSVSNLVR